MPPRPLDLIRIRLHSRMHVKRKVTTILFVKKLFIKISVALMNSGNQFEIFVEQNLQ